MKEKNRTISFYKIPISIIFGLLGFVINFHTIIFPFGEYTAAILFGLLFPMLITISWGWKYGLLSALAGGCQTMWWLWGPSNGYAIFFVVPPFTLWIMWHGLFANLRNKQKEPKWWLNKYIIEIPFRLLNSINLFTLSRWAITLNPPPWSWASDAPNTIPMHFSNFVVIKQAVVGYIILLLADVLLNLGFVRRFFKLKEVYNQTNTGYLISASLLIGALFWFIHSIFGSLVFHSEKSFLDSLMLNITPHEVFVRTLFILACLVGGLLTSKLLRKQRESKIILQQSERRLSQAIEGNSIPTFIIDKKHIVTHWNKACENLTGVSASEIVSTKKHWSPFYSEQRPVMADLLVDKLSEKDMSKYYGGKYHKSAFIERAYEAEDFFPNLGEDGKWIFFTAAPLKDHKGNIIGAIETLQDITERKKAEEELSEILQRERFWADIIRNASVGVAIGYPDGHLGTCNAAYQKITGYSEKELQTIDWNKILTPPEWEESETAKLQELHRTKKSIQYGKEYIRKNGSRVPVELLVHPRFDSDGNVECYFTFVIDITDRKQAEEELKKHRDHLEDMVQKRTAELQKTINLMAGREVRMGELKEVIRKLHAQLEEAGLTPVADDPLKEI